MNRLYLVIPAYNEEETIRKVIEEWYAVVERYDEGGESRLLVIDDGSRDRTYEILCEMKKDRPLLLVHTKENSGHGSTLLYGYKYALAHDADYIFQTDSDGQTRPEEFHAFWQQREGFDMLIGSRNRRQDGFSRVFVTRVLKLVIRLCFGVSVADANTPFRLMRASTLQKQMRYIPEDFNLPNVIISVIYAKKRLRVKYIPITFRPRQGGVNSINLKKISRIGVRAIRDFRKINVSCADRSTDGKADRSTDGKADRSTDGKADRSTGGKADKSTGGKTDRGTDANTDRGTDANTDRNTNTRRERDGAVK